MSATRKKPRSSVWLQMALDRQRAGQELAALREEKRLTQEDLATRTGISKRQIQRYEGGESMPRWKNLDKLAEALGPAVYEVVKDEASGQTPDLLGVNGNEPEWVARLEEKLDEIRDILAVEEMERAVTDAAQEPPETPATEPRRPAASDR